MYPAPYTNGETFEYTKTTTILQPVVATEVAMVPTFTPPPAMGYPSYPAYPGYPPPPPPAVIAMEQQRMMQAQQQAYVSGAASALALCCCL